MRRFAGGVLPLIMRGVLGLAATVLSLGLLLGLGAGWFAWRVADRPVPLAPLRRVDVLPPGVTARAAALQWDGWSKGPAARVRLTIDGVRTGKLPGVAALHLEHGRAELILAPLLQGRVAPRTIALDGLDLHLAGTIGQGGARWPAWFDPAALRLVDIRNGRIAGLARGVAWVATLPAASLRRAADGAGRGRISAILSAGTLTTPVQADIRGDPGGALHIQGKVGAIRPGLLAALFPELAGLAALDAPVTLAGTMDLSRRWRPAHATVQAQIGAGSLSVGGGVLPLMNASVDAGVTLSGQRIESVALTHIAVTLASPSGGAPTRMTLTGGATPLAAGWRVEGRAGFDQLAAADLPRLWPPGLIHDARQWVVANVTGGTAHDARFTATLDLPAAFDDATLSAVSGSMQGDDLVVHWLRPVPPAEHIRGTLVFVDPDTMRLTLLAGQQGDIIAQSGTVLLTGLAGRHQFADVDLHLGGPLTSVVAVLAQPKLRLLSTHPLPFTVAAGTASARLQVHLPLVKTLDVDSVGVRSQATLSGVRLRGVVAGRDLEQGQMALEASNDGLTLTGQGALAGIPLQLRAAEDFRAGPPSGIVTTVDASGRISPAQLAGAGFDIQGEMKGNAALAARYAARRDGRATMALHADLGDAAIALPLWRKKAGEAATITADAVLDHDRLVAIRDLEARGPRLRIDGHAEMAAGQPSILTLDRIAVDRTRASGEIRLPPSCGGAICVRLAGAVLDLSHGLGHIARARPDRGRQRPGPWRVHARFDRVLLDQGRALGPVRGEAESDGTRLVRASLEAPGVQGRLVRQGQGRLATLQAADAGALLGAISGSDAVRRGTLRFDGRFDDARPGSPLAGRLEMDDFSVRRAVVAGKMLQVLSGFGVLDALRGPGLVFSRAVIPVHYLGNILRIGEARAFSLSLGVTAKGQLDLGRDTADLTGTIVPAYAVNSALGRLPVVGRLFSPERGGGVLAAGFTVTGPLAAPDITINPLSALTPGFLRGLFTMFK